MKNRLIAYAGQHPDLCKLTGQDKETGYKAFAIDKGRASFRLTAPYSEERRRLASEAAKKNGIGSRTRQSEDGNNIG